MYLAIKYTICSHFPKSTRWILNSSVSLSLSPDYTDLVRKLGGKMNFQEFSILICVTISFSPWLLFHSISLLTGIKTNKKCISAARFTQFYSIVWLKINLNLPKKFFKKSKCRPRPQAEWHAVFLRAFMETCSKTKQKLEPNLLIYKMYELYLHWGRAYLLPEGLNESNLGSKGFVSFDLTGGIHLYHVLRVVKFALLLHHTQHLVMAQKRRPIRRVCTSQTTRGLDMTLNGCVVYYRKCNLVCVVHRNPQDLF